MPYKNLRVGSINVPRRERIHFAGFARSHIDNLRMRVSADSSLSILRASPRVSLVVAEQPLACLVSSLSASASIVAPPAARRLQWLPVAFRFRWL